MAEIPHVDECEDMETVPQTNTTNKDLIDSNMPTSTDNDPKTSYAEVDRNLIEESNLMGIEENNAMSLRSATIVAYADTSEGEQE